MEITKSRSPTVSMPDLPTDITTMIMKLLPVASLAGLTFSCRKFYFDFLQCRNAITWAIFCKKSRGFEKQAFALANVQNSLNATGLDRIRFWTYWDIIADLRQPRSEIYTVVRRGVEKLTLQSIGCVDYTDIAHLFANHNVVMQLAACLRDNPPKLESEYAASWTKTKLRASNEWICAAIYRIWMFILVYKEPGYQRHKLLEREHLQLHISSYLYSLSKPERRDFQNVYYMIRAGLAQYTRPIIGFKRFADDREYGGKRICVPRWEEAENRLLSALDLPDILYLMTLPRSIRELKAKGILETVDFSLLRRHHFADVYWVLEWLKITFRRYRL